MRYKKLTRKQRIDVWLEQNCQHYGPYRRKPKGEKCICEDCFDDILETLKKGPYVPDWLGWTIMGICASAEIVILLKLFLIWDF